MSTTTNAPQTRAPKTLRRRNRRPRKRTRRGRRRRANRNPMAESSRAKEPVKSATPPTAPVKIHAVIPGALKRAQKKVKPKQRVVRPNAAASARSGLPDARESGRPRLPKKTVAPWLSKAGQDYYRKVFPGYEYSFINAAVRHEHICSAHARKKGEKAALKRLAGCYSRDNPLIDVGFGGRLTSDKNVHGVECGNDPYTLHKLVRYGRTYPNALLKGNITRPTGKWTYCRCNFVDCKHVPLAGSLLFTHSIYYNSPTDIVRMLLKTRYRTAASVHHVFRKKSGGFYLYDGRFESRYTVDGKVKTSDGYDDRVIMQVVGNEHTYAHARCTWLMDPECFVNVRIGKKNFLLTWTKFAVENVGDTEGCVFNLHEVRKPYRKPDYPILDFRVNSEPVKINDSLMEKVFNLRTADCVQGISKTQSSITLKLRDQGSSTIPMKMISDLRRWFAGKPINKKTWATLTAEARRIAKPKYYPECELNSYVLAQAVLPLCVYIVSETSKDSRVVENFFKKSNLAVIDNYNDVISFEKWNDDSVTLLRAIFNAFKTWKGLFLTTLIVIFAYLSCVGGYDTMNGLLGFSDLSYHVSQNIHMPGRELLEYQEHQQLLVSLPTILFLLLCGFCVWLFLNRAATKRRTSRFAGWETFKCSVVSERRCVAVNSAIPDGDGFPGFESEIDTTPFIQNSTSKLKILSKCNRIPKHQVVTAVGVCFCTAAPMVHSSSQDNLIKAIKTRVIHEPIYTAQQEAWDKLHAHMLDELVLVGWTGTPRSLLPNFTRDGIEVIQHDPYTLDEYLARYPAPKRKVLERYAQRVFSGEITTRQIVYNCFVKREKIMAINKHEHVEKKPRVIQGGPELEKISSGVWFLDYAYALKHEWNIFNWIWFCSGATTDQYNYWFAHSVDELGGLGRLTFVGSDFSTYDVTQGPLCIGRECDWYRTLGILKHVPGAKQILKSKMKTTVYGKGVRIQYLAQRKSGTNDTTTGNSKITGEVIGSHAKENGLKPFCRTAVIGDDNFTIMSTEAIKRKFTTADLYAADLSGWSRSLGFKLKVQTSDCPSDVEFVSCRFYPIDEGLYAIGKKPGRVLVKLGYMMHRPGRSRKHWLALLKGICLSYLPTGNHVPFLRVYLRTIIDHIKVSPRFDRKCEFRMKGMPMCCSSETFTHFEHTYGLGQADETVFACQIKSSILKYGLPCIIDSHYVDELYRIDNLL